MLSHVDKLKAASIAVLIVCLVAGVGFLIGHALPKTSQPTQQPTNHSALPATATAPTETTCLVTAGPHGARLDQIFGANGIASNGILVKTVLTVKPGAKVMVLAGFANFGGTAYVSLSGGNVNAQYAPAADFVETMDGTPPCNSPSPKY